MRRGKGSAAPATAEQQAIVAYIAGLEEQITEFEAGADRGAGAHRARATSGTPRWKRRTFMLSGVMRGCDSKWASGEALSMAGADTVRYTCPVVLCMIDQH